MPISISLQTARELLLACQGLLAPPEKAARKADVLAAIRRMHLLQIDTISVVARSPYFVLFSRVKSYEPRWLDELLAAGKVFEYWAHAACFIPAGDYGLYASLIHHKLRPNWHKWEQWGNEHKREVDHVRGRIVSEGALKSSDFENEQKRGIWWDWKVEKIALEYLLVTGELMIARRDGFQRVYDLRERVRPGWDDSQVLEHGEIFRRMVSNSARALGIATEPWLRDYYRLYQKDTRRAIAELIRSGELLEVVLEQTSQPAYLHQDNLQMLKRIDRGQRSEVTALLSPFDPIVWHRARASTLFGFDYQIECYTVQQKRQYGYFTLPILHQGRLIGRIDPKAHRREGVFEIRSLHLEPEVKLGMKDWKDIARAIQNCADWHGTPRVELGMTVPGDAVKKLRAALRK